MLKKLLSALLLFSLLLTVVSCTTPGGRHYTSSEKNKEKAASLILKADAETEKLTNGTFDYSFFVTLDTGETKLKMGTQNVISFTDRGTENARIHRKNTFTSTNGGIALNTMTEDHYYVGGVLHTSRFGSKFKSVTTEQGFLDYTETSEIAVNTEYLNVTNFESAEIFNCGGVTEIYCEKANDKLKSGIYAFIGFTEDSGYVYTARDISLTVVIGEDGTVSEKRLLFKVDYHPEYYASQKLTYNGEFSFTAKSTKDVKVETPSTGSSYAMISDIKLLNSLTTEGYKVLSSLTSLDATYDEYIKVADLSGQTLIYDIDARFTEKLIGDKLYYGSIDNKNIRGRSSSLNTSPGIFNDDAGYHVRTYDKDKKETEVTDKAKPDETNENMMATVANTFSSHMLLESDISNLRIHSDSETEITFYLRLSSDAAKYYTVSLMSVFAENVGDAVDPDQLPSISYRENDVYVTVRKSDGCILRHSVKFKAVIGSSIDVQSEYSMVVNSTDASVNVLTLTDFENSISAQ